MEAVDSRHKTSRYRVEISALTCCKIHCRRECAGGLLCAESCTSKVQRCCCRVVHSKRGISRRVLHGLVEQFGLFRTVAHGLVGELHSLVDLCKLRHGNTAGSNKRHCQLLRQISTDFRNLAADILNLLSCRLHLGAEHRRRRC